ncbi:hypothetical protein LCGC14_1488510 [marine sediment metagenome]|uniref:Uncharacterized protein n=1 Tax=marine sediment metagenome TaxID=412755 RepID=A0A0F9J7E9_9ZZZZ|nr:MAG: hypothetical protein Lokiarch_12800 [Candidatus Lokiarchaeum sp. GC14_75]
MLSDEFQKLFITKEKGDVTQFEECFLYYKEIEFLKINLISLGFNFFDLKQFYTFFFEGVNSESDFNENSMEKLMKIRRFISIFNKIII